MEIDSEGLEKFFEFMAGHLDEKQRRLVAGGIARLLGRGGLTVVAEAAGMSRNTVIDGAKAYDTGEGPTGRVRAEGGGRPRLEDLDPSLLDDLDDLVEPGSRGDPMSPLRWTLKSTRQLAKALNDMGHQVGYRMVGYLLHDMGYSLQATAKVVEGAQHPDRNGQFEYINALAGERLAAGQPGASGSPMAGLCASTCTTSPTRTSPRPSLTGCSTWAPTRAGCGWATTMAPRRSR